MNDTTVLYTLGLAIGFVIATIAIDIYKIRAGRINPPPTRPASHVIWAIITIGLLLSIAAYEPLQKRDYTGLTEPPYPDIAIDTTVITDHDPRHHKYSMKRVTDRRATEWQDNRIR